MISFPNLGLNFRFSPIAFSIFGRDVYWYGLIMTAAILASCCLALMRAKKKGMDGDRAADMLLWMVICGFLGARIYYVLFKGGYNASNMFNIWQGGIAVYGGVIGGVAALFAYCKRKKISFWEAANAFAPAVLLGQAIGRWGNFANREAFGGETMSFFRMEIERFGEVISVHPTFLYESVWCLLGLFVITRIKRDEFWQYIAWYGLGRFFIEGMRTDSLMMGPLRVSQMLALASCAAAITIIVRKWRLIGRKSAPKQLEP